ncbi:YkgJ family cysteine cluster protein [Kaarinaea lacus]
MSDNRFDWDEEFADDPDYLALSHEERQRIIRVMEKMLDMGMAGIYGVEDAHAPDSNFPCGNYLNQCRAKCCTLIFALTKQEVNRGLVQYNKQKPFFIARDADGYCPHLDRQSLQCKIYHNRPLRCRQYDCRNDRNVWPDGLPVNGLQKIGLPKNNLFNKDPG